MSKPSRSAASTRIKDFTEAFKQLNHLEISEALQKVEGQLSASGLLERDDLASDEISELRALFCKYQALLVLELEKRIKL